MKGRPRLVEVGVPIGSSSASTCTTTTTTNSVTRTITNVNQQHNNNDDILMMEDDGIHNYHNNVHVKSLYNPNLPQQASSSSSSSLQRAAAIGGVVVPTFTFQQQGHTRGGISKSYHVVIGNSTSCDDLHHQQQDNHNSINNYSDSNMLLDSNHDRSYNDDDDHQQQQQQHQHYHHQYHSNHESLSLQHLPTTAVSPATNFNNSNNRTHKTHFVIGEVTTERAAIPTYPQQSDHQQNYYNYIQQTSPTIMTTTTTERMTGVEIDIRNIGPLIVMDGANVAYAYAHAQATTTTTTTNIVNANKKIRPNLRGILIAYQYFHHNFCRIHQSIRIIVVLPQSYLSNYSSRTKPTVRITTTYDNSNNKSNAYDIDHEYHKEQSNILHELLEHCNTTTDGSFTIVSSPNHDDDDAYVLQIAQRENNKNNHLRNNNNNYNYNSNINNTYAYILSNDLYRDAQERDTTKLLYEYLNFGPTVGDNTTTSTNIQPPIGPGRISYTFVNMGNHYDDYGDVLYDIVPNPRHPLIHWIEQQQQQRHVQQY